MKTGVVLIAASVALVAGAAHADARAEAAAKQALARAVPLHAAHHDDGALEILSQAEKMCEPDRCSPSILAALLRDIGTMQLVDGYADKARSNFAAALAFDPSIDLNPAYAVADVRAVWNAVKSPSASHDQPSGDFDHTAPSEQKRGVPLPVYVEYGGSAHPTSVVVRYATSGASTFKRLVLARVGGGWGGVIPCAAVTYPAVQYYFQGVDAEGLPILESGDKRHPYTVPVRDRIDGRAPKLPGHRAPTMCGEGLEENEASSETNATPDASTRASTTSNEFARVWIGASGGIDFTVLPSGSDVCSNPQSDPNWSCTSVTGEGIDFPNAADDTAIHPLVPGKSGNASSGLQPANVRVKLTFDYAITANLLVGAAIGYVAGAYGGAISPSFPPVHFEVRGTWVFGSSPLSRVGFAPYAQLGGGAGEYDANLTLTVTQNGIAGARPVQAWHVGGPGFVFAALGARFAFSPRVGLFLGARATAAFGTSFFPAFGPEMSLAFGL